jgi:hypothetical protein
MQPTCTAAATPTGACPSPATMRCYLCGEHFCPDHLTSIMITRRHIGRLLVTVCRTCFRKHQQMSSVA